MKGKELNLFSDHELTNDTPYLALTGMLHIYGVSYVNYNDEGDGGGDDDDEDDFLRKPCLIITQNWYGWCLT